MSVRAKVLDLLHAAAGGARPHLPLHHPRPGVGQVRVRPAGDHVPRPVRRVGDERSRSTPRRSTRTPGRCSTPCRSPTRAARAARSRYRAARSPTRSRPPSRLPVPPALPVRVRRVRLGGPRRRRRDRGPLDRRRRDDLRGRAGAGRRPRAPRKVDGLEVRISGGGGAEQLRDLDGRDRPEPADAGVRRGRGRSRPRAATSWCGWPSTWRPGCRRSRAGWWPATSTASSPANLPRKRAWG